MFKVKVKGMKELEKALSAITKEMTDELQVGTEEAASKVASIIRARAPGSIADAVEIKPLPRREHYPEVTLVGVNYNKAPHGHLVEFGTGPRYHASGKYVGQVPANPFFRRSIDESRRMIKGTLRDRAEAPIRRR